MTQTEAKPQTVNEVFVLCDGIVDSAGFALTPLGFAPTYVDFIAGKPTKMAKHYADYLVSQDPTKFSIVAENKKDDAQESGKAETAKPEKKKAARAAKK